MKTILIYFDSLIKNRIEPYCKGKFETPNFKRLSNQSVVFCNSYVGSLPCMPARRDLHTGRLNFLHKCWGPMEPFDVSVFDILKENNVHTHLISDHIHYWEEGGGNYHTKYNTWEIVRGQEGDFWKAHVNKYPNTDNFIGRKDIYRKQDCINRLYQNDVENYPLHKVFEHGLNFLKQNKDEDNWLLQIEPFDPHEPFTCHELFADAYKDNYSGPQFDWPDYAKVCENEQMVEHVKNKYQSLVYACDAYLGKVLDFMDNNNMWDDTMLIVSTDHGYLLGEHGWWAKTVQPAYNEIANIPLFIWDPRFKKKKEIRKQLTQAIDIAPTILDYYNIEIPSTMLGKPLVPCIKENKQIHEAVIFGIHGCHVNVTDGRYLYMRAPNKTNSPLYDYTLMPVNMKQAYENKRLLEMQLSKPFDFTNDTKLLKVPATAWSEIDFNTYGNALYDLANDPNQLKPIKDSLVEEKMLNHMKRLMQENDAPTEQYERMSIY